MTMWDDLRDELRSNFLIGPLITRTGKTGYLTPTLRYTGLMIEVATARAKLASDILLNTDRFTRFPMGNLCLQANQNPFSTRTFLHDEGTQNEILVSSLYDLLDDIYTHCEAPMSILGLLTEIAPALSGRGSKSPLRHAASSMLDFRLSQAGFAIPAFQRRSHGATARVVWAFPIVEAQNRNGHYLSAFSLRFVHSEQTGDFKPELVYSFPTGIMSALRSCFFKIIDNNLDVALSEAGKNELRNVSGKVPADRTLNRMAKLSYVRDHPELWNFPRLLAEHFIANKLYSAKSPKSQIVEACKLLVREVQERQGILQ